MLCFGIFGCAEKSWAGTLLFSDDFEDGNVDGWGAAQAVISTQIAHAGTYAVKVTHDDTAAFIKTLDINTMLQNPEITIRYWWYTAPSWVLGNGVKFVRLRGPSQIIQSEIWWSENLGQDPLSVGGHIYGGETNGTYGRWTGSDLNASLYGQLQSLNYGQWMKVEIHYRLNTVDEASHDGFISVKFDDVERLYYGQVRWRNTETAYTQFYLPSNIGTSNINNVNYIDDVEIWSGTPDVLVSDIVPPAAPQGLSVQ